MKRLFLAVITLVVISISSANAQAVFGVRVGASIPTMSDETGSNIKGKFGLEVGPVLYYTIKHNLYINTGALFSYKSFDMGESTSFNMYNLDVPIYLGYNFANASKVSFYAQAGPYVGFKLSEKVKSEGESINTDLLKSIDGGLAAMVGVNIQRFKIELGYKFGLLNLFNRGSDLIDESLLDPNVNYSIRLSSLFLGVSYVF